jgi:hypothetical protein
MTQALYAHMNNKTIKSKKENDLPKKKKSVWFEPNLTEEATPLLPA